jgi:hypothetical protein
MENIETIRSAALAAVSPLKPAGPGTAARKDFLITAERTNAGNQLPAYYLVYLLLVDLLGFENLGKWEKIAWSVPVDFEGRAFLIDHRKSGLGVFAAELPRDETAAGEIVSLIRKGIKAAQPYFDWRAEEAIKESKLNVINRSKDLYQRFQFFVNQYKAKRAEYERSATEWDRLRGKHIRLSLLQQEANWLALAAIDSFFSWTEHVFIHLAILQGKCITGDDIARLAADANWDAKFKVALDINEPDTKHYYDELTVIRRQLRNFVAHGSFGKQGEAFSFHSGTGEVPVTLPHLKDGASFRLAVGIEFVDHDAITLIHDFIGHLWSGPRRPARIYLQHEDLPLILTMAQSGEYARAMASEEEMAELVDHLSRERDRHANMDF